jgi:3-hydroxyisobutyrate dehydrogenase-like beta-hydroxyacid dehydrogenase
MVVGFVGVGTMGGPMCRNIVRKSGAEVLAFDLDAGALQACTAVGATAAGSIAELASAADVIFTSLPAPPQMEAVTLGPGGIVENARPGSTYFDLTTNSLSLVRRVGAALEARGVTMLDAPVSGGPSGAEAGTLSTMVGGPESVFDAHLELLRSFAGSPVYLGELGAGTIAKLVNNMIAMCTVAASAEGLMLGAVAGVDVHKLDDVIRSSSGDSIAYRALADRALSGDYTASFALDLCYKDIHLALELADELNVPTPQGAQLHNLMRMARGLGFGKDDPTSVMRVYETALQREVRAAADGA